MQNKLYLFRGNGWNGRTFLFCLLILVSLCGCVEHRYYVSPFNGNNGTYHPVPMKSDSVKSGYYATAAIGWGSANDEGVDNIFSAHANLSGGHHFGPFQAFYGAGFSLGNYKVNPADGIDHPGNKAFRGVGFEGGLNAVIPFKGGEWRVLGVETSIWNESGRYLQFRKALPDAAFPSDAIDLVIRNRTFRTIGGYSEILATGGGFVFGMRLAAGTVLSRHYVIFNAYEEPGRQREKYGYGTLTYHMTHNRYTGFAKLNFATKASTILFGLNYRLR